MILPSLAPSVREAKTNSWDLYFNVCARTIRDIPIQPVMVMATMIAVIPGSIIIIIKMTTINVGIPINISTIRCMMSSVRPPKYPEIPP